VVTEVLRNQKSFLEQIFTSDKVVLDDDSIHSLHFIILY
jgi:hypothetical protein